MERIKEDIETLRDYLENLTDLFRDISNKIHRLESQLKIVSRENLSDSPPQKRSRGGVWEE
jgi:hypothetical protein